MKNRTFVDELSLTPIESQVVNAFGSDHFNPDQVIEKLRKIQLEMEKNGENTGSILAVMNILPDIAQKAKELY